MFWPRYFKPGACRPQKVRWRLLICVLNLKKYFLTYFSFYIFWVKVLNLIYFIIYFPLVLFFLVFDLNVLTFEFSWSGLWLKSLLSSRAMVEAEWLQTVRVKTPWSGDWSVNSHFTNRTHCFSVDQVTMTRTERSSTLGIRFDTIFGHCSLGAVPFPPPLSSL